MSQEFPVLGVAGVAIDSNERVLVVKRGRAPGQGLWTVPGGKVRRGETLTCACRREFAEETGLRVRVGELAYVVEPMSFAGDENYHYVVLGYRVQIEGGDLRAGDDVSEARWVSEAELSQLDTTDGLSDAILLAKGAKP